MHQVRISSHYGRSLVLGQCAKCGGIWFDHLELYEAKQGEAQKIEVIDLDKLAQLKKLNQALHCPKDKTSLKTLDTKNILKDLDVETCPKCNGVWVDRGEFQSFQKAREKKKETSKIAKDKLSESIDKLLQLHSNADKYQGIANFAEYLMSPVVRTPSGGFKIMSNRGMFTDEPPKRNVVTDIAFTVLNIIMRILIRK